MKYIEDNLEALLFHVNQISSDTQPLWGKMSAQRMIEHLTDGIFSGIGKIEMTCSYEGEKLERSRKFLLSDEPMPREFKAQFFDDNAKLRNDEFELAVDEFADAWLTMEEFSEMKPEAVHIHPVFGPLNQQEWRWMHRKHITHHFTQFGIEITDLPADQVESELL